MRIVLLAVLLVIAFGSSAQVLIPFEFTSDDDNKMVRENDSFKYYSATRDTPNIVAINEEMSTYKLLNRDRKVIAEGSFSIESDKYFQEGKWLQRFESGKVKRVGYYKHGLPIGTWQEYYASGKLRKVYNFAIFEDNNELLSCLSGTYQEYYSNGNMKLNGFYTATLTAVNDTVIVNDPISGKDNRKVVQHRKLLPVKTTDWEIYTENGELERKDKDKDDN